MSALTDALDELAATLTAAGENVADSAAAIRPPVAVIDPPTISTVSATLVTIDWLVTLTEQPPGSERALRRLLDRADAIAAVLPIQSGTAGSYSIGGQDLPSYTLSVQQTIRRDPVEQIPNIPLSGYEDSPIQESAGIQVTTGAIAHEYGAWVEMIDETVADADYVYFSGGLSQNNTNTATVIEIGIGAPGSETPLVSGIAIGGWNYPYIRIPIPIPSGSRIAFRTAGVIPSRVSFLYCTVSARSPLVAPSRPSATVYGVDPATSAGVIIDAVPTEIGILEQASAEISVLPSLSSGATITGGDPTYWEIMTGAPGSEVPIGIVSFARTTSELVSTGIAQVSRTTFPGVFPVGTRVSARRIVGSGSLVGASLIAFHN